MVAGYNVRSKTAIEDSAYRSTIDFTAIMQTVPQKVFLCTKLSGHKSSADNDDRMTTCQICSGPNMF